MTADQCLAQLKRGGPQTPDQVALALGASVLSVRPRLTDLRGIGRVRRTGERRRTVTGKLAHVLEAIQ